MLRRTDPRVRFFVLASLVFSLLFLAAGAFARADEPGPYVAPVDRALQPELPEMSTCPDAEVPVVAVEEAEGEEVEPVAPELRELGHLRLEQQQACKAQTERLDQVIERLWWVTVQTLALDHPEPALAEVNEWLQQAAGREELTQEDVHAMRNALTDPGSGTLRSVLVGLEDDKALPVLGEFEAGPMEVDPELVSSIDSSGEAVQAGLYIIAGLIVGLFVGGALWKLVDRGT